MNKGEIYDAPRNDDNIFTITVEHKKDGITNILRNGSLYEQINNKNEGFPHDQVIYSLIEVSLNLEIDSFIKKNKSKLNCKELSDEELEKYNIIDSLNTIEKNFQTFLGAIIFNMKYTKNRSMKEKIKYLIYKYGANFEDGLDIKLSDDVKNSITNEK